MAAGFLTSVRAANEASDSSKVLSIPSRISWRPKPPASTTPASRRIWSWLGVFSTAARAPAAAAAITRGTVASGPLAAVAAARPASRATVRIVPSVGLFTARYAALAASSNAAASSAGVSELLPSTARAKPRKIWERITPELPRAPIRLPWDASLAILLTSVAFDSLTSSTADCRVSSMLVPVSPSGTGKTLRRFTSSWLPASHVRLPSSARLKTWPSTPLTLTAIRVSGTLFANALNVDVDLDDGHVDGSLDLELDGLLQVVRHLRDPDAVLHDHVHVDGQAVLELEDVDALVHVLAAQQL